MHLGCLITISASAKTRSGRQEKGLVNGGVDANESFFLLFDTLRHYDILDLVRHALLISRRLQLDYLTNIYYVANAGCWYVCLCLGQ